MDVKDDKSSYNFLTKAS